MPRPLHAGSARRRTDRHAEPEELRARAVPVLEQGGATAVAPRFTRLLDRIASDGSIRRAALMERISYRHARAWLQTAEAARARPLAARRAGGVGGGHGGLTLDGMPLVRRPTAASASLSRLACVAGCWIVGAVALAATGLAAIPSRAEAQRPAGGTLVVYNAGSLAGPLKAVLDSFAVRSGVTPQQESGGSLETARKITDLGKIPDVIALADYEVFPQLLMPTHVTWYGRFARNRMVIAYTPTSRAAGEITGENWYRILRRPGIEVGRSDPSKDPNGYRTLLTLQLAERHYAKPGLADRLLQAWPARNIRAKEVDLVALLQAGELDYIWSYESVARAARLRYVVLPAAIDLGSVADSATYATASTRVMGSAPGDTIVFRGQPIVYGFSVPLAAPHPAIALRFAEFLTGPVGRRILRRANLDALERVTYVGTGVPPSLLRAAPATTAPRRKKGPPGR